jgi:uncharacterized membrane protein YvbJ
MIINRNRPNIRAEIIEEERVQREHEASELARKEYEQFKQTGHDKFSAETAAMARKENKKMILRIASGAFLLFLIWLAYKFCNAIKP